MYIIIVILAVATASGSIYSLATGDYTIMPYTQMALAFLILTLGFQVYERSRILGIICFLASVFGIFVSIYVLVN